MEIAVIAEAVVIVVLVLILASRERDHDKAIKWMVQTEQVERSELLNRIQHPERVQVRQSHFGDDPRPEPEIDPVARAHMEARARIGRVTAGVEGPPDA